MILEMRETRDSSLYVLWKTINHSCICIIENSDEKEKERRYRKDIFESNFPKFPKQHEKR